MTNKTENGIFGKALKVVFGKLSFNAHSFADDSIDTIPTGTVRNWLGQRSFPSVKNYEKFIRNISNKMNRRGVFPAATLSEDMKTIMPQYSGEIDSIVKGFTSSQAVIQLLHLAYGAESRNDQLHVSNVEDGQQKNDDDNRPIPQTKVVVFEFDGTLTKSNAVKTTWESIWEILGYPIQDCKDLHSRFDRHEITHDEWCELTEDRFKARKLHKSHLLQLVQKTELIDDIEQVFQMLEGNNIRICVVSGSIDVIIRKVLGNLCTYLHDIKSNLFDFDSNGYLEKIVGTKYDFEGKATYIKELSQELKIEPKSVLYVGNSWNDEFVHRSGARTLCINPRQTSFHDIVKWNDSIEECSSLSEIYKFIVF